jgi:hypothetical protein
MSGHGLSEIGIHQQASFAFISELALNAHPAWSADRHRNQ